MTAAQYARGRVALVDFPFVERPTQRGPKAHFCLVIDTVERPGLERLIAVCYGTSRLDDDLLSSQGGAVLSIPSRFIKVSAGFMAGEVAHFVLAHVALVPESWLDMRLVARLDFMRAETRTNDSIRQRLYQAFVGAEPIMQMAALQAINYWEESGNIGLPPGKVLRKPGAA